MFPHKKLRRFVEQQHLKVQDIKIYCVCRMPVLRTLRNSGLNALLNCGEWYHMETCVSVQPSAHTKSTPSLLKINVLADFASRLCYKIL